ncbi:MAG: efflux RND transporter periplasmic adaptor subunit [Labilithrix sp.]|nr:efflux RND transporter periplasmic adaptor subunit [Labilithrix sp.]
MKRLVSWIVGIVVVAGVAFGVHRWRRAQATPDITWKTAAAEKRRVAARITAGGTLQATVTVTIGAQVSGRIQTLNADFNDTVKKGKLLAKLDPQLFEAAVEQANANYLSAKAGLTRAEAQQKDAELVLVRTKNLADQTLASAAELQTAETNVTVMRAATDVAKAALAQASAALNQARVNLSFTNIYSPIDGTVISRSVDVGQTVASSLQAPVLFTIAEDLKKMQVHTNVAEGDVGRIEAGMDATFTVDAFPGQTFRGKVGQIRNAPQTLQNVVTYDAVVDVDNADLKLRPGMTATVTIAYAEREEALAIPNAALRFRPPPEVASAIAADLASPSASAPAPPAPARKPRAAPGAASSEPRTVYVLRSGSPRPVRVVTGLSDGSVSEITSGDVAPGDEVIVDVTVAGKPAGGATTAPPRMGRMF